MTSEYTIRVKLHNGMVTDVKVQAISFAIARGQAEAYGQVLGLIESRYI